MPTRVQEGTDDTPGLFSSPEMPSAPSLQLFGGFLQQAASNNQQLDLLGALEDIEDLRDKLSLRENDITNVARRLIPQPEIAVASIERSAITPPAHHRS